MMTLPDFVRHFYPELSIEKARHMLQDILKVVLYKGNTGHQEILRGEGKCNQFDPVPLVLVKDIMNYMPQMKYMFNNIAATSSRPPQEILFICVNLFHRISYSTVSYSNKLLIYFL